LGLRRGWCRSNPVKLADRPVIRRTQTRIRFLDQAQLDALLAAPYPDDAFGRIEPALYLTAAMTGLRRGELLGLRWRDVDFSARKLRVVRPYVRGAFGDPKSEGSGRSVPMADRVARLAGASGDLVLLGRRRSRLGNTAGDRRRVAAASDHAHLLRSILTTANGSRVRATSATGPRQAFSVSSPPQCGPDGGDEAEHTPVVAR
jgi:integrase